MIAKYIRRNQAPFMNKTVLKTIMVWTRKIHFSMNWCLIKDNALFVRYSQGKIVSYSTQYKKRYLAASDLFHMFTKLIKFYTFYYHMLKSTDVCKR